MKNIRESMWAVKKEAIINKHIETFGYFAMQSTHTN